MAKEKFRIFVFVFLVVAIFLFFNSLRERSQLRKEMQRQEAGALLKFKSPERLLMGTVAKIIVVTEDRQTAELCVAVGFDALVKVDEMMSDYKADSELSRVNKNGFAGPVKVSEPLFEVIKRSGAISEMSGGAFDITIGPLSELFRRGTHEGIAPTDEEIAAAKAKVGYKKLILDEDKRTVQFSVEGMKLDPGGIAKGYGIDQALEAIILNGAKGGMVDVGGDIRCFGVAGDSNDSRWSIGVQDPAKSKVDEPLESPLLVVSGNDMAVATSGNYQRFFEVDGKRFSHILSSETGQGTEGLSSVTIISRTATDADGLATAVTVMGMEKGLALIESLPETEVIFMTSAPDYDVSFSSGAEKYLK